MMRRFVGSMLSLMMPLLSPEGDGGGGGGDDKNPDANNDGTKSGDEKKPEGTEAGGAKPGVGGKKEPTEDPRTAGILKDLQGERNKRQTLEAQVKQFQADLDREQKRVRALSGLDVKSPEDADDEQIKAALIKRFPWMGKLDDAKIEKLLGVADKADSLEESNLRQWTNHANKMLDGVIDGVSKEVGGDLTDRQKARLQSAYLQEAQTNPEFLKRHEAGDPKLIAEFVKDFIEDWFEPARRKVTQQEANRQRRVPSARDRSVPGAGGKKVNLSDDKEFGDAVIASFRSHGGEFGE